MSLIDAEKGEGKSHTCAMAFHEKAGLSQVDLVVSSLNKVFSLPPSRHCHHPSIRTLDERCALGACWAFSVQPVLPSVWRTDPIRWSESLLRNIPALFCHCDANLLHCRCFEHVDNLGAYTASRPETGLLIPSGFVNSRVSDWISR
jgi:hypothetical protein